MIKLHVLIALYSLISVFSKLASAEPFLSMRFCLFYGGMLVLLGAYAIAWQQIIKKLPLTTAFANKAVTTVWGLVWGTLIFHETITPGKLAGIALVIVGVLLFSRADKEAEEL